ncbi:hypothetical protein BC628DRAFT_1318447 [Trametes gibbosa]|nr:hypothetical protein BC628DRAFT_1318447 [Trametes gibbosa]
MLYLINLQLYDARLSVIFSMGLSRHSVLFDKLSPRNMSGDETDGTTRKLPMAYRIIESRWQSDVFKTFMRALDAMYRQDWELPGGNERATGLWRNCYSEDWLCSLAPYQRRALNIIDASYDFDLAAIFDDGEEQEDSSADEVDAEN